MKIATTLTLFNEIPRGVFDAVGTDTTEVFAEVLDVGMNEYYAARSAGLAPEIAFELTDWADYNGQKLCEYNGKPYRIIRTTRRGMRERLICERVDANDAG